MEIQVEAPIKLSDSDLIELNRKLVIFGASVDNRPIYRVVWSEDQTEKRYGEHKTVVVGQEQLKLGHHFGTKELPKYDWLKGKYILEKLVPNILGDDIKTDDQLVYEMVIDFPLNKPPWFEAIVYFLKMGEGNEKEEARKYIEAKDRQEQYEYEKEVAYFEEILAEGGKE